MCLKVIVTAVGLTSFLILIVNGQVGKYGLIPTPPGYPYYQGGYQQNNVNNPNYRELYQNGYPIRNINGYQPSSGIYPGPHYQYPPIRRPLPPNPFIYPPYPNPYGYPNPYDYYYNSYHHPGGPLPYPPATGNPQTYPYPQYPPVDFSKLKYYTK